MGGRPLPCDAAVAEEGVVPSGWSTRPQRFGTVPGRKGRIYAGMVRIVRGKEATSQQSIVVAGGAKVATIQHNVAVALPVFGQEPLMTSQQGDCILNKKQPFTENRSLEEKGVGR